MRRLIFILLWLGSAPLIAAQDGTSDAAGHISFVLPAGFTEETAQVSYFGGDKARFVKVGDDLLAYEIDTVVSGLQAANLKVIAYMKGCEILSFDLHVKTAARV